MVYLWDSANFILSPTLSPACCSASLLQYCWRWVGRGTGGHAAPSTYVLASKANTWTATNAVGSTTAVALCLHKKTLGSALWAAGTGATTQPFPLPPSSTALCLNARNKPQVICLYPFEQSLLEQVALTQGALQIKYIKGLSVMPGIK